MPSLFYLLSRSDEIARPASLRCLGISHIVFHVLSATDSTALGSECTRSQALLSVAGHRREIGGVLLHKNALFTCGVHLKQLNLLGRRVS